MDHYRAEVQQKHSAIALVQIFRDRNQESFWFLKPLDNPDIQGLEEGFLLLRRQLRAPVVPCHQVPQGAHPNRDALDAGPEPYADPHRNTDLDGGNPKAEDSLRPGARPQTEPTLGWEGSDRKSVV